MEQRHADRERYRSVLTAMQVTSSYKKKQVREEKQHLLRRASGIGHRGGINLNELIHSNTGNRRKKIFVKRKQAVAINVAANIAK